MVITLRPNGPTTGVHRCLQQFTHQISAGQPDLLTTPLGAEGLDAILRRCPRALSHRQKFGTRAALAVPLFDFSISGQLVVVTTGCLGLDADSNQVKISEIVSVASAHGLNPCPHEIVMMMALSNPRMVDGHTVVVPTTDVLKLSLRGAPGEIMPSGGHFAFGCQQNGLARLGILSNCDRTPVYSAIEKAIRPSDETRVGYLFSLSPQSEFVPSNHGVNLDFTEKTPVVLALR